METCYRLVKPEDIKVGDDYLVVGDFGEVIPAKITRIDDDGFDFRGGIDNSYFGREIFAEQLGGIIIKKGDEKLEFLVSQHFLDMLKPRGSS